MQKRLTRVDVPLEATWRLEDLFATSALWLQEADQLLNDLRTVTQYAGRLGESANTLLACLESLEDVQARISRFASYAHLHTSGDNTNPDNQARSARSGDIVSKASAALSFVSSEILSLPEGALEQYYKDQPKLELYRRYLSRLMAVQPHQLSAETEAVLASLGEVWGAPYRIYLRSKLSDMSFESVQDSEGETWPVSFALYENKYIQSPDTALRRASYDSFTKTLAAYQNTFAETYATEVKKQVVMSGLRKYDSVTDMLLQPQEVSQELYHNILDTIQEELAPHMRRFASLKQRVLGLDKMLYSDLKAPLDPDYNPETTYADACRLIQDALQIMGPEYSAIVEEAFSDRWVDYADNVGKSTGAFCSTAYGSHSYILISWADNMRGAFTLAHEVGHAGHFTLTGRHQSYINARPSMYFIEAPSTMNELLLAQHIMKQSDDKRMRRWVIEQLLNTYYHNYVTHLLEGEMQRKVYAAATAGEALNATRLNELKLSALSTFWGDTVELDEGAGLTWMRQPHYYMSLYPYTYAAGLTASTAAAQLIQEEGQPAVDRWLQALRAGGTLSPLELMKLAGVDMSTKQPIQAAVRYVGELITELEQLFDDIDG
ncbi:oligoendopeptidase F [Paenibacillus sp. ACRRX]|uniref:oligoendopeptidase F n=1 Tax=Paenibacillus sp. ACRRX TaxID=2918206 RepID=UPI001EF62385|nr:oligoendopeptidase F [Paenibacillus sp. ACRRX]MCG7407292.1 oligoendopeptidase F [Paenibacillus sp. ACRRX]